MGMNQPDPSANSIPATPKAAEGSRDHYRKQTSDWSAIERDYRANILSGSQMCTKHGLSHSSIANKAKREDWQRDLAPIIKRDVARQLIELAATSNASIKGVTDDLVAVKHGAAMIVSVIQRHRSDITDLAELCRTQLAELRTVTVATDKLLRGVARLKDLDSIDEEQAKTLIGDLRKLATLPSRVGALTAVSSNFDRLQTMERRAFGVKDDVDPVEPEGSKKPRNILIEFVEAPYRELE